MVVLTKTTRLLTCLEGCYVVVVMYAFFAAAMMLANQAKKSLVPFG